jgi:uncharacterized protein with PIN domain
MIEENNYRLVEAQLKKFKGADFDQLPKWVQQYILTHKEKEYDPGFEKCSDCNGRGYDAYLRRDPNTKEHRVRWERESCDRCGGTGQITWLDSMFPNRENND